MNIDNHEKFIKETYDTLNLDLEGFYKDNIHNQLQIRLFENKDIDNHSDKIFVNIWKTVKKSIDEWSALFNLKDDEKLKVNILVTAILFKTDLLWNFSNKLSKVEQIPFKEEEIELETLFDNFDAHNHVKIKRIRLPKDYKVQMFACIVFITKYDKNLLLKIDLCELSNFYYKLVKCKNRFVLSVYNFISLIQEFKLYKFDSIKSDFLYNILSGNINLDICNFNYIFLYENIFDVYFLFYPEYSNIQVESKKLYKHSILNVEIEGLGPMMNMAVCIYYIARNSLREEKDVSVTKRGRDFNFESKKKEKIPCCDYTSAVLESLVYYFLCKLDISLTVLALKKTKLIKNISKYIKN